MNGDEIKDCKHIGESAIENALNNRRTRESKIARNSVFDCHLSPVGRQMAIENSLLTILSMFVDSISVFDCRLSGVVSSSQSKLRRIRDVYTLYVAVLACLVWFVALRPRHQLWYMWGRSVRLTTLFFLGKLTRTSCTYFRL